MRHFLRLLINVGGGGGGGGGGGVAARGPGRGAENKVTGSAAAVIMQTHVTARICIGTVITRGLLALHSAGAGSVELAVEKNASKR